MRLGDVVPGLKPGWRDVTLEQLAHHTSGVASYTDTAEFARLLQRSPRRPWTARQLMDLVPDRLHFPPGTRYRYSNSGTILIGLMIEAATTFEYGEALDRYVLNRLAMRRSNLPLGFRMPDDYVRGYDDESTSARADLSEVLNATGVGAAGGVVSSPLDLGRYIRAYASGRLFDGATLRAQRRWLPGGGEPYGPGINSAGLGIYRYQTNCGTVLGHTGNFPGYTAFISSTPDGRRSAVVLLSTALNQGMGQAAFGPMRRVFRLAACAELAAGTSRFNR
jgi:D-alanyl-D-alanine carboxypeptidase